MPFALLLVYCYNYSSFFRRLLHQSHLMIINSVRSSMTTTFSSISFFFFSEGGLREGGEREFTWTTVVQANEREKTKRREKTINKRTEWNGMELDRSSRISLKIIVNHNHNNNNKKNRKRN